MKYFNTHRFKAFPYRILLPGLFTVALFVGAIFLLILPRVESRMMADRRNMVRELTETACSLLEAFHQQEKQGRLTREQAQAAAVELLRQLRYGAESKDYFWINDMRPVLIMHPYRRDLEGAAVSDFRDSGGKYLFMDFVETARKGGAGYVDYQWQWKDDPLRIVPKISYVKAFEPWGWIVGTGIYVEEVRAEISAITRHLSVVSLAILLGVIGLCAYIFWQNLGAERRRRQAVEESRRQREQLFQADKMATLGTLVSGVAHEINNPISAMTLNAPLLAKVWESVLPILDAYDKACGGLRIGPMAYAQLRGRLPLMLTDIADGARRVKAIVGDLKDFARQNPDHLDDAVEINRAAEKSIHLLANLIKKSTGSFQAFYGREIPPFKGNTCKIEQVIINLLVNACQALTDTRQAIELTTSFDEKSRSVVLAVRDEGCGIKPELLQRIHDPFFTTKRESGGTGLGLAIAGRIVADHHGRMTFESVPGRGTTARLEFPAGSPVMEPKGEELSG